MRDLRARIAETIPRFIAWLESYGETSYDYQTFFAGGVGARAKATYYRNRLLGVPAVAPIVFCEALLPSARRLFWKKQRFPIADAHYAMGFAILAKLTGEHRYYDKAIHFLRVLENTRSPGYPRHGWGYPFDWVTRTGVMRAGMPLITTLPYVYEAFDSVYRRDGDQRWLATMESIAEHALNDYKDLELTPEVAAVGYNPADEPAGVVNASAYRAFLLFSAARQFDRRDYQRAAERNLNFVLRAQKPDGSWFYAEDGVRDFIDHFHTCFVMKALVKIEQLTGHEGCTRALERGVSFYVDNLFDRDGRPRPFARAPRLTVYRHELYDYAECINLGSLLLGRFPELDQRLETALHDLLQRWCKRDGSFRSRRLWLGWDDVPMHRWAQSQVFRSLCFYLAVTEAAAPVAAPGLGAAEATLQVAVEI